MSILHKQSKIIFYSELYAHMPEGFIEQQIKKYTLLEKSSKQNHDKQTARILIKRYEDFQITVN